MNHLLILCFGEIICDRSIDAFAYSNADMQWVSFRLALALMMHAVSVLGWSFLMSTGSQTLVSFHQLTSQMLQTPAVKRPKPRPDDFKVLVRFRLSSRRTTFAEMASDPRRLGM